MISKKYRRKFHAAIALLTFCLVVSALLFAKGKIDEAISVSTSALNDRPILIIDAGHKRCALSIVI